MCAAAAIVFALRKIYKRRPNKIFGGKKTRAQFCGATGVAPGAVALSGSDDKGGRGAVYLAATKEVAYGDMVSRRDIQQAGCDSLPATASPSSAISFSMVAG